MLQQRAIECFDGCRIGEIDGFVAVPVHRHEVFKLWTAGNELREVVTTPMQIARMQIIFFGGPVHDIIHGTGNSFDLCPASVTQQSEIKATKD